MPRDDYAILMGISHYADPGFPPLQGPPRDVARFHQWLIDPKGGDVNPNQITSIVSPASPANVNPDQTPPTFNDFQSTFKQLITGGGNNIQYHSNSRLYLYFSGHGFCEYQNAMPHAAIYAANASRWAHYNIAGTLFALWAKEAAVFGEIVLVMDCCRDVEATKTLSPTFLPAITNLGSARNVKLFCIYAAPKGGKAQERPSPELNNQVHSLLTHALLDAFQHAPPDEKGNVTGQIIKGYLEDAWPTLCGSTPADPPEIYIPPKGDITFFRQPSARLLQKFRVSAWLTGDPVEIYDGRNQRFASLNLPEPGAASVVVTWADQTSETVPISDGAIGIPLPAGFYRVLLVSGAKERQQLFQAGGADVDL
jgi:hypothetical protein